MLLGIHQLCYTSIRINALTVATPNIYCYIKTHKDILLSNQRENIMNNGQTNKNFLLGISPTKKNQYLSEIATHYGISPGEVFEEVTDAEAEALSEYMTSPLRFEVFIQMNRPGISI